MIRRPSDHSARLRRGELADEDAAERLAAEQPEAAMRRREFLGRTAALAGGAGLAATLPLDALVASAARSQVKRFPLPSPSEMPLDTIVVLMMENRSFDHYFGWFPGADGRNVGLTYPDADGKQIPTHRLTPDYQGCGHPDPDHGWNGGRWQYHGGRNDRFVTGNERGTGSDEFAIGYYLEEDLGFLPAAARAYTNYDRWFCSLMASTFPNRHFQWSAQSGGTISNDFPDGPEGFEWETIFDRAQKRGVSVKYFGSDLPVSALYGQRAVPWSTSVSEFYSRCAAGTLPQIAFVDPPFGDIGATGSGFNLDGAGVGAGASDHPHSDVRLGQAFISDVVHAFIESPQYRRGALFVDYDEWGGFFDHVKPRFVPDDRRSPKLEDDFGFTGFRCPGVCISPFARRGGVSHMTVTHESILKLISYRFDLGHLTKRHRYASNIGRSLDFTRKDFDPPELPDPGPVAAQTCAMGRSGRRDRTRAEPHGLTELESSGYLDRIGFPYEHATYERVFREPDRVRRARAAAAS